jgi:hypothetical protein
MRRAESRCCTVVFDRCTFKLSREREDTPAIVGIAGQCYETCSTDVAVLDGLIRDFNRVARSLESVS